MMETLRNAIALPGHCRHIFAVVLSSLKWRVSERQGMFTPPSKPEGSEAATTFHPKESLCIAGRGAPRAFPRDVLARPGSRRPTARRGNY